MWKKDDRLEDFASAQPERAPQRPVAPPPPAPATVPAPSTSSSERAIIGRSITVRGDVTGDEDLVIQGRVEGSVDLQQHSVTVGPDGEVIASIVGRVVTIEGRVEGNVDGGEQVTLRNSAFVKGDITAPRVVLENGARFRGLVDMGEPDSADAGSWGGRGSRGETRRGGTNGKAEASATAENGRASGKGGTASTDDKGSSGSSKGSKPNEAEAQITI